MYISNVCFVYISYCLPSWWINAIYLKNYNDNRETTKQTRRLRGVVGVFSLHSQIWPWPCESRSNCLDLIFGFSSGTHRNLRIQCSCSTNLPVWWNHCTCRHSNHLDLLLWLWHTLTDKSLKADISGTITVTATLSQLELVLGGR